MARGEQQVFIIWEVARVDDGGHLLFLFHRNEVDYGRAARVAAAQRNLVHLDAVHLAHAGEEQHVIMGGGNEQLLHEVVVLEVDATHALAAALLLAVGGHGQALDVAAARDGDDHVLVGDEVLDVQIARLVADLGAALVPEALLDLFHFLADDELDLALIGKHALVVRDLLAQLGKLGLDLLALQAGQAAQAHLEDVVGLHFGKTEALHQALAGLCIVARGADDGDDLVDIVERDDEAFQNMGAFLCFAQIVLGAPDNNIFLVQDVVVEYLLQAQHARHAVDQRKVDDAEAGLQLRVLVELVEHNLRLLAALEVDDDAHTLAVGFIVETGDLRELLLLDQLGDLLDELGLVDLVGNLGHDNAVLPALILFHVGFRADGYGATTRGVGVAYALRAHDGRARGKVRAGDVLHELVEFDIGVVHDGDGRIDCLHQVVGRHVGGHADGNALRAVDQQVGEARGKHFGFLERFIVVGLPVDRLLLKVAQQLHGLLVQARFRVTHGSGAVAVNGAEVAVAIHQRHAHVEILRKAHHGVVDGGIAVGVVLTHAVADGARGLHMRLVRRVTAFVHSVENAAVHRFQAVAHIRQRAGHDNRHGVFKERRAHLLREVRGRHLADVDVERAHAPLDLCLDIVRFHDVLGYLGIQLAETIGQIQFIVCHVAVTFRLDIQETLVDVCRVRGYEVLTTLDILAHELVDHAVHLVHVLDGHLAQGSLLWLHGGLPQLLGVHFAQALVALHVVLARVIEVIHAFLERLVVVEVLQYLARARVLLLQTVERRAGNVDIAAVDELGHEAEEEGQQQDGDVCTIDVGIGHDDDAVVACFVGIEFLAHARTDGGDERADGVGGKRAVLGNALHVQDLAAQGQNSLIAALTCLLGRTTCGIALDDVELGECRVLDGAIRQLAG